MVNAIIIYRTDRDQYISENQKKWNLEMSLPLVREFVG